MPLLTLNLTMAWCGLLNNSFNFSFTPRLVINPCCNSLVSLIVISKSIILELDTHFADKNGEVVSLTQHDKNLFAQLRKGTSKKRFFYLQGNLYSGNNFHSFRTPAISFSNTSDFTKSLCFIALYGERIYLICVDYYGETATSVKLF